MLSLLGFVQDANDRFSFTIATVDADLFDVGEECGQTIEILGGVGVKFVIVTLGAAHGGS